MTKPKPPAPPRPKVAQAPMSTFCAFPRPGSHGYCHEKVLGRGRACHCPCHTQDPPPSSEGFDINPPKVVVPDPTAAHAKVAGKAVPVVKELAAVQVVGKAPAGILRIHLGPTFWDDHVARGQHEEPGTHQVEIRRYVKTAYVELDGPGWDELISDARHYAETGAGREGFEGYGRVVVSARATVRALEKAGRP